MRLVLTIPPHQVVTLRRGETWETYDLTSGEPCPAVVTVVDARAGRVKVGVEAGVGIRCVAKELHRGVD